MENCLLKIKGVYQDEVFNLESKLNRDNGYFSWVILRDLFLEHQFSMHTADVNIDNAAAFELHMDVQKVDVSVPCYLLMLETPQVCPANSIADNLVRYRKVFTWNDALVDGLRFVKANFPNPIHVYPVDGFAVRDRFCCLISGNKSLDVQDGRILYPERVKVIRWFEEHAPQDFDLYGVDWDISVMPPGLRGKLFRQLWLFVSRFVKLHPFPSYRGKVQHKRDVLQRTRFSICYENIRDLQGYITEKIFDSFISGCVPVYWGASNVSDYIPADCFIDRRQFADTEAVYKYLKKMTEDEYRGYQQRIAAFLQSDGAYPFSSEFFAETIVNTIVQDIGPKS
jgi:hypothetical protein